MTALLRTDFEQFRDHCVFLRGTYNTFYSLYGKPETQEVLKNSAVWFFDDLHRIFQDSFFVQIGRICDRAKTGKDANLSISYFVEQLKRHRLLTEELEALEISLLKFKMVTKDARNKAIAHSDVKSIRRGGVVGAHTLEESEGFFKELNAFTDRVATQLGLSPLDYSVQAGPGDVIDFIRLLKKATKEGTPDD